MKLIDSSQLDEADLERIKRLVDALPRLGADFDKVLQSHGFEDLSVKVVGLTSNKDDGITRIYGKGKGLQAGLDVHGVLYGGGDFVNNG